MPKAAAVGGHQVKLALVGERHGKLALDGAEREGWCWRPVPVELAQPLWEALDRALSALKPTPSALQALLNEKLR
jgi:hypothetical protein